MSTVVSLKGCFIFFFFFFAFWFLIAVVSCLNSAVIELSEKLAFSSAYCLLPPTYPCVFPFNVFLVVILLL